MNDVQELDAPHRESKVEDTRRRIVAAAERIIERDGVAGLTARAVARESMSALGSPYSIFGSLEGLRLEATASTMRDLREVLAASLDACEGAPADQRLIALATAYAGFARKRRNAWEAMLAPRTMDVPPAIGEEIAALFGLIGKVLRETGKVHEEDIPVAVKALWASVHGMVQLAVSDSMGPISNQDLPRMVRLLVTSAIHGLLAGKGRAA